MTGAGFGAGAGAGAAAGAGFGAGAGAGFGAGALTGSTLTLVGGTTSREGAVGVGDTLEAPLKALSNRSPSAAARPWTSIFGWEASGAGTAPAVTSTAPASAPADGP
jgi:hypothetical protein